MPTRFRSAAVAAVLTMLGATTLSAQDVPDSNVAAVRAVVETYMHGLKFNDVESFRRAFWPEALLLWSNRQGGLGRLTQEAWYRGFKDVAGKEEEGTIRIVAIDVVRDIASVKVVEDYPASRYTNFLSLVRFDGGWRIVNKVFSAEKKPSPGPGVMI
jgi:hypothetical protein